MQKHVFQIEKLRQLTLLGIITLFVLLITLIVMLQTSYIQTKITQYVTKELSKNLKTEISIENVNITLLKGFKISGITVKDLRTDTLLYIKNLYLMPSGIPVNLKNLKFKFAETDSLYLNIYETDKNTFNITEVINTIIKKDTNSVKNFNLKIKNFNLRNSVFSYKNNDTLKTPGINYNNLYLTKINIKIDDIDISEKGTGGKIRQISFKEKSGFKVNNISTETCFTTPENTKIKNLIIETDKSNIRFDSINLKYPDKYSFSNYKTELYVGMQLKKSSFLEYKDLAYVLSDTSSQNGKIFISGGFYGYLNNFNLKNLSINFENIFSINTDSQLKNLTDPDNLNFNINITEFTVNTKKLSELKIPGSKYVIKIPPELKKLETINYKGKTAGTTNNFVSKGVFSSNFGKILLDASAKKDSASAMFVTGKIYGTNLEPDRIFNNNFKDLTFEQDFSLYYHKNKKTKLTTEGNITKLTYKHNTYRDIKIYASLNDKIIDSLNLNINQPEIKANLNGKINFSGKIPHISLSGVLAKADLKKLNVKNNNSTLSLELTGNFKGTNIDNFEGKINITNAIINKPGETDTHIKKITLTGKHTHKDSVTTKTISLKSDFADASLKSNGNISESINSYKNLINKIFSKTDKKEKKHKTAGNFIDFEINLKNPDIITNIFTPEIHITKESKIFGYYKPEDDKFNLSFNSEKLTYKQLSIKDFYAVAYTRNEKMFAGLGGSSVSPSKHFTAYNLNLEGDISKDTLNFNLIWNNFKDTANYSADISGTVTVKKKINDKNEYTCNFKQSELIINDIPWNFDNAKIKTDTSHINISNLKIKHKDEEIYLDGNISRYRGDFLFLKIRNLDMNNFRPLFSEEINIKGKLNGISTIANLYDRPLIFTKDSVSNLTVNNMNFGNLYIKSYWDDAKNTIHANAYNLKGKRRIMNDSIYGDYNPENKTLNFTADIRSMLLKTFKDYYKDLVEFNNSAFLSGIINLKGNVKNPEITGNIKIKQTTAYVKYLNTFNTINEMNLIFDRNNIIVNKTKMLPKNGNGFAYISGNIRHKNFSNFSLNIDINTQNYEILDIIPADSAYYYGRAFATGNINFSGPFNNIFMDANLTTNKNTDIFIPISSDRIYTKETNFLTFKTDTIIKTKNKKNKPSPADINGFEMNMKLDITPDAEIQILPEENTGDIYTKGSGGLNLTLNKSGDFNVFGTYVISKGNYIFNIENIIRKNFKIQDGSTIEWFGKPQNARVNINAVYTLYNIALSDLTQDPEERTRTKVDCIIEITGKLLNPDFKLKVVLPETLTEYTAKLNSLAENEMNEQFLSLLLLSNFQALPGIRQDNIGGDQVTGEILSKQLNSLLRKIKYVDVNVDYRLGNAQYSDEYKIGVKKSFLNDRIEVSGNLGIGGKETQNTDANNYIGEFEVEAKLNPKGTVRAKVYNKANDRIENDGDYTQGIGFIWRRDFDNFFDFLHFKNKKDTAKFSPPDVKNKKNRKEK